jgi:polyhydroxyalkanoate synthesis repressor PhaR
LDQLIRKRKKRFPVSRMTDKHIPCGGKVHQETRVAENTERAVEPIVIKKYANRRLYNTSKSSYVTLDHLAQMVRDGQDFVVNDAKSGQDITRAVLAQIIFDEEAKGQTMLPANFLRQLIRLYGDTLQGFVPGYLEASMETFSRNQEQMREQVQKAFEANPALANFEALARSNMEWFENALRMFAPFASGIGGKAGDPTKLEARKEMELEELKRQLATMQEQLSQIVKDK